MSHLATFHLSTPRDRFVPHIALFKEVVAEEVASYPG